MLAQSQPIDLRSGFELAARKQANKMTKADIEKQDKEERLVAEKLAEVEKSRSPINFFNMPTLTLMSQTPSNILCELGLRCFVGSRDVP